MIEFWSGILLHFFLFIKIYADAKDTQLALIISEPKINVMHNGI